MFKSIVSFLNDPSGLKRSVNTLSSEIDVGKKEIIRKVLAELKALKDEINKPLEEVLKDYKEQLRKANKKAEFYCMSLNNIGDVIPDMLWFKYKDGTYAFTNRAIRENLLFDDSPVGKTDIEMGNNAVEQFGASNHNFGAYCAGSDDVVIDAGHRQRFIEYGMSGGKPLVLEVYKNVVRNTECEIIGTVGSGRDITEMIFTMYDISDCTNCCDVMDGSKQILKKFLDKYLYENGDSEHTLYEFYKKHKG